MAVFRCVIMVGMPYPNPKDPELLERMKTLNCRDTAASHLHGTSSAGQTYYGDLCMKVRMCCTLLEQLDWLHIGVLQPSRVYTLSTNPSAALACAFAICVPVSSEQQKL